MEQFKININYDKLNQIKTILELLKIKYQYYLYFYNTYMVEFTTTTQQLETIKTILEG
jgi:recombinational DNA repair protein (RecF pathway)